MNRVTVYFQVSASSPPALVSEYPLAPWKAAGCPTPCDVRGSGLPDIRAAACSSGRAAGNRWAVSGPGRGNVSGLRAGPSVLYEDCPRRSRARWSHLGLQRRRSIPVALPVRVLMTYLEGI